MQAARLLEHSGVCIPYCVPWQEAYRHAMQGGLAYAQGDVEVAKGSMLDLLSSAHAASAQDRAVALGNLGCLVARDWQHNLALLCFSRALSISKVITSINMILASTHRPGSARKAS